eukprot:287264_1
MAAKLFLIWLGTISLSQSQTITIDTQLGKITGNVSSVWPTKVNLFAGVRYAVPPLGNLRFRPSQVYNTPYNGIYDATQFAASCVQPANNQMPIISEDCLFLNIWTSQSANSSQLLPVMFYIHGGSFFSGSGAQTLWNGLNLVGQTDGKVVVISINYRLGSLGFLQNEEIYNEDPNWMSYGGMNGLYDQITALNWVVKNIGDYGGDSSQITIFGESAGGLSVCYLLISPIVPTNIFQRGVIESGACNGAWGPLNQTAGLQNSNAALTKAGYPINNLTYLRSIDAKTFAAAVSPHSFLVSVDKLIITDLPSNIFTQLAEGSYKTFNAKQGVIIGWNSIDGLISYPFYYGYAPNNPHTWEMTVEHYFPNSTQATLMEYNYYYPSKFKSQSGANEYELAWYSVNADTCLGCPSLIMAQQIADAKVTNIYVYEFGGPTNKQTGMNYAPHMAELGFIFDWPGFNDWEHVPWSQSLADSMLSSWTNFGIYGVPNVTNSKDKINVVWST